MGIEVVVDVDPVRGRDLRSSSKFGSTTLEEIRPWRIDASCTPVDRRETECRCRLTRVDVIVTCEVRLNPRLIARGFFDPNPEHPRGYVGRRENGRYVPEAPDHIPLDEESVLIHERSHCRDIADAIQEAVKSALDRNEEDFVTLCRCERKRLCYQALLRMVRTRIRALGQEAYEELLRDAHRHRSDSETERRARQAQIDDFEVRDEQAEAANDDGDGG